MFADNPKKLNKIDEKNKKIVRAIVTLAQNLKLSITAEGVENDAQLHEVLALGCQEAQGYFFSPPLSADQFEQRYLRG